MLVGEFIEDSNRINSISELANSYFKAIRQFGFTKTFYSLLSDKNTLCEGKHFGFIKNNYPQDWIERYIEKGYLEDDPVYRLAPSYRGLFAWKNVESHLLTKKQKNIIDERNEAGLKNGHSMFISGPMGEVIGIGIANDGTEINVDKDVITKLYAIINQFNLRCIELKDPPPAAPPPQLSRRERDVLHWASSGKSNSSIAAILGISEKTVEFHFSSVFKKLQVNNRILAVLKAIHVRLI
jgi:DNA-binding CsgD family transcriptional regulator